MAGVGVGAATALLLLRRRSATAQMVHLSASTFVLMPFGVLGTRLNKTGRISVVACEPDPNTAMVDPAGLPYIQKFGPGSAGAASGAICTRKSQ